MARYRFSFHLYIGCLIGGFHVDFVLRIIAFVHQGVSISLSSQLGSIGLGLTAVPSLNILSRGVSMPMYWFSGSKEGKLFQLYGRHLCLRRIACLPSGSSEYPPMRSVGEGCAL